MSRIAAIVLAAGRSTRMGGTNKLLADLAGKPILRRVVEAALASKARPVLVVTGHQADRVKQVLAGLAPQFVSNPDHAAGLSSSLTAGIRAVPKACAGALVVLGDMPGIGAEQLDILIAAFAPDRIVVPVHAGKRGNPLLWPAAHFPEMLQLEGDAGAKRLLDKFAAQVTEVDVGTAAIFADVDTPHALAAVRKAAGEPPA